MRDRAIGTKCIIFILALCLAGGVGLMAVADRRASRERFPRPTTSCPLPDTLFPEPDESGIAMPGVTEPLPQTEAPATDPDTETSEVTDLPSEETTTEPSSPVDPPLGGMSYENQLSVHERLDDAFLNDAAFVGDSRMLGFCNFTNRPRAYALPSLTVRSALTKAFLPGSNGGEITVIEKLAAARGTIGKVYCLFGVNEYGWDERLFAAQYRNLIAQIREAVGNEVSIYLMTEYPICEAKAYEHGYRVTNARISVFNDAIAALAAESEGVYLLHTAEIFCEEGTFALPPTYANDGVHLVRSCNEKVYEYLLTHSAIGEGKETNR